MKLNLAIKAIFGYPESGVSGLQPILNLHLVFVIDATSA
jgi:hypothetical protein